MRYVVLKVIDGEPGFAPTYAAQVASIIEADSPEEAARFNVGSHPDAEKRGKPYEAIVIEESAWHEFQVYSERIAGVTDFRAYPSEDPTIS